MLEFRIYILIQKFMDSSLNIHIFYLFIIFLLILFIPGFIFNFFLKKEGYDFSIGKSISEIFIARITCFIIGALFSSFIFVFLLFFIKNFGLNIYIAENIRNIIFIFIYFFFYYKFLNSTLGFFIFDEEIRKKILLKFILISEIVSSILFFYCLFSIYSKYVNFLGINLF